MNLLNTEALQGKSCPRHMKVLRNDQGTFEPPQSHHFACVGSSRIGSEPKTVREDLRVGNTPLQKILAHDQGFIPAFFSNGTADKNARENTLPIKLQSTVEPSGKSR